VRNRVYSQQFQYLFHDVSNAHAAIKKEEKIKKKSDPARKLNMARGAKYVSIPV
jgi:hypothetical protein